MMTDDEKFDEPFDTFDDVEYNEDDWDGFSDEPVDLPQEKRSSGGAVSKLISFLVIVGFLGFAGFFVYNKYGAEILRSATTRDNRGPVAQNTPNEAQEAALEINTIADPNNDSAMGAEDGTPPMPNPISTADMTGDVSLENTNELDLTPLPDLDGIEVESLPDLNAIDADAMTIAENADTETPSEAQTEDMAPAAPPVMPQMVEADNTADDFEMDPVDSTPPPTNIAPQNDAALARVQRDNETLQIQLSQAQSELQTAQKRIAALERSLAQAKKAAEPAKKPAPVKSEPESAPVVKQTPPPNPDPAVRALNDYETAPKTQAPAPEQQVAYPAPTQTKTRKAASVPWVLRSAKTGEAVVSRKNSDALQTISVGSSLSGIGRVQSISNATGKWVVIGTQGTITQ